MTEPFPFPLGVLGWFGETVLLPLESPGNSLFSSECGGVSSALGKDSVEGKEELLLLSAWLFENSVFQSSGSAPLEIEEALSETRLLP